jgi:hypothetical protein
MRNSDQKKRKTKMQVEPFEPRVRYDWPWPANITGEWLREHFFLPTDFPPYGDREFAKKEITYAKVEFFVDPYSLLLKERNLEYPIRFTLLKKLWFEFTFKPLRYCRWKGPEYLVQRLRSFKLHFDKKSLSPETLKRIRDYSLLFPTLRMELDKSYRNVFFAIDLSKNIFEFLPTIQEIFSFTSQVHMDNHFFEWDGHPNEFSPMNVKRRSDIRIALNSLVMDLVVCFDAHYCILCDHLHTHKHKLCKDCYIYGRELFE